MKKRLISGIVLFLIVLSSFAFAQEETTSSDCSGFWGSISCFLFGSSENRAGKSWFDRENVVGEADRITSYDVSGHPDWRKFSAEGTTYYIVLKDDNTALFYEGIPDREENEPIPHAKLEEGIARAVVIIIRHDIPDYNPPVSDSLEPAPAGSETPPVTPDSSVPIAESKTKPIGNPGSQWMYGGVLTELRQDEKGVVYRKEDGEWKSIPGLVITDGDKITTQPNYIFVGGGPELGDVRAVEFADTEIKLTGDIPAGFSYKDPGVKKDGPEVTVIVGAGTNLANLVSTLVPLADPTDIESNIHYTVEVNGRLAVPEAGTYRYLDNGEEVVLIPDQEVKISVKPPAPVPRAQVKDAETRFSLNGLKQLIKSHPAVVSTVGFPGAEVIGGFIDSCTPSTCRRDGNYLIVYDASGKEVLRYTMPTKEQPYSELVLTITNPKGEKEVYTSIVDQSNPSFPLFLAGYSDKDAKEGYITIGSTRIFVGAGEVEKAKEKLKSGDDITGFESEEAAKRKDGPIVTTITASVDGKPTAITTTNYETGIQTVSYSNGMKEEWEGSTYDDAGDVSKIKTTNAGTCTGKYCFIPNGGYEYHLEGGNRVNDYLLNPDYNGLGASRTLTQINYYDPITGRSVGMKIGDTKYIQDGDKITATKEDGTEVEYTRDDDEVWTSKSGGSVPSVELEKAYQSSASRGLQDTLGSIYAATNSVKSYPALSHLLEDWFGGKFSNFLFDADKAFAPLLGSQWFPSAFCEGHYDIEPDGMAVIKTPLGTYQAVAHIEAERSPEKTPLLCERYETNETPEVQWVCARDQVCVDNNLCYLDEDGDEEPDSEDPIEGYFYKLTWAAAAPADEAFTPFLDENGVAVSLNIFLDGSEDGKVSAGNIPLYRRGPKTIGVIELKNGARDRNIITKYSNSQFTEACIGWDKAPSSVNIQRRDNVAAGISTINDVCVPIVKSTLGQVNWDRSGRPTSSTTSTSPEVTLNTDW